MCPFCLATMALVVAGAVPTGGRQHWLEKFSRKKSGEDKIVPNLNNKEK